MMARTKLSYFDFAGGRGEDCRLALHIAGVEFEDDRFKGKDWAERKPNTPFGAVPVLSVEGRGELAQSNAILAHVGREHGLHPSDPWAAAQHEAMMMSVEDLRQQLAQATVSTSEEEKKASREEFASGWMKSWSERMESKIAGPFVAGDDLQVVDLKISGVMKFFKGGGVDYIDAGYFAPYPKLESVFASVQADPRVIAWNTA